MPREVRDYLLIYLFYYYYYYDYCVIYLFFLGGVPYHNIILVFPYHSYYSIKYPNTLFQ